jgi:hypothetical protein
MLGQGIVLRSDDCGVEDLPTGESERFSASLLITCTYEENRFDSGSRVSATASSGVGQVRQGQRCGSAAEPYDWGLDDVDPGAAVQWNM